MHFSIWDCGTLCWFGSFVFVPICNTPHSCSSQHSFYEDDPIITGEVQLCPDCALACFGSLQRCWQKLLLCVAGGAFNLRGKCISPGYPPTPTTLLPPSLMEMNGARRKEDVRSMEARGSPCPSSTSSSCDLGSAMSSPVTLPFINLRKKNRRTQKSHFT